ncbi:hypothetical protein TanjilG_05553 [Lupinus angustifolius]|uniref:DUF1764 domain-containing protein n=1 Tax=Lupinus angustifolius TaxID=3871 RepID=A0A1J7I8H3_LUPAN|nr:PREDICTED: uncharacterized protein C6G9.01c [Lupinus angustifolius]XP_019445674.1 PREDICTED: uncharacterized protein C6G9.01c [Lupinus angustifolius]XP_019445675.1 PREDICTED: uncharacterized protein C6G9.01c [Lupinus angustifolius]OIW10405.1 hypothetical protein TanjilG_05553 [Lupinus angustifolius]
MTKKSSKIAPSQLQENPVVKEEKPSSASKKAGSEIDEIFASKKRKKPESKKSRKHDGATKTIDKTKKTKRDKKTKGPDDGGFADAPSRPRKKTGDGLTIYTEEELGLNSADVGGTPLCPFDCSCCF